MTIQDNYKEANQADQKPSITVEIWSDYLCPWCFIGEWNMTNALNELGVSFTKEHRSYQTNPTQDAPESIYEVALKYGMNLDSARHRAKQIEQSAKQSGLIIHMDKVQMVNTFDAHCLVAYAKTQGVENTVSDRLMEAAFVKGWNIADIDRLIAIAVDAGLDAQPVKSILLNKQFNNIVEDDISNGQRMGVKSVPYYRINNRYEISGANSKEQFKHYIQSVLEKEKLDNMPSARSCGDAGCIISE